MAVAFYIISKTKILGAFNFHGFASSVEIAKINRRWNFLVFTVVTVHGKELSKWGETTSQQCENNVTLLYCIYWYVSVTTRTKGRPTCTVLIPSSGHTFFAMCPKAAPELNLLMVSAIIMCCHQHHTISYPYERCEKMNTRVRTMSIDEHSLTNDVNRWTLTYERCE